MDEVVATGGKLLNKVAILYICTGKYVVFWKDFFDSYEKFFLPHSEKHYYVFTDADKIYREQECERIHKIYQQPLDWPDSTLMRFHIFLGIREELQQYDYIFFMNANCQAMDTITEEEFLPGDKELLVVPHLAFWGKTNMEYTYDRNPKSTAYIPKGEGRYYICGGVNGGKTQAFLTLMEELRRNIDVDKKNGQLALWHDESHINRYIIGRDDYRILTPAYCYPEGKESEFPMKILIRDKSKWIPVDSIKNQGFVKMMKFYWKKVKDKTRSIVGRRL